MEHDVVMVACLLHEHPLPADQTAQLLQGLRELSFSATFRETVFGPLSEARAAQLAANLLRDGGDAALTILRNACGSSRALQRAVAAGVARGEPERGAERPLALQMVCNAAVQNPEAAEAIAGGWRAAAVDGRNAAVVAALLHTLRVWCAEAAAVSRLDGLTQQLLPELAAHWEAVAGPGADLWLASAAAHAGRPLAELQALLAARPAVLALAMEKFGGRLAWQEEAAWIAVHLREGLPSFAALFADDGPAARDCARRLVLEHGCLQTLAPLLAEEADGAVAALALQLLGNLAFRNAREVAEAVDEAGLLLRALALSRFDPEGPLRREWALLLVRACVESSPAVHERLAAMRVLEIDRDSPANRDLERRTGARLELLDGRPILVKPQQE